MDSNDIADFINTVAFVTFTVLLVIGAASTLARGLRYRRAHMELPVLWARDRDLIAGLALPFVLIFGARALDIASYTSSQLWWTLLTAIPAVYGVARYAYFEIFVIERVRRSTDRAETPIERQDRLAGNERRNLEENQKRRGESG